jgi:hypothetical protein
MTAKPGDNPELGAISGPPTPPSPDPDLATAQAISQADQAARPSPTQQIVAATNQHIADACGERDRLRTENKQLQGELDRLHGELDRLRVDHQELKDKHNFSRIGSVLSTVFLFIGPTIVSSASIWPAYVAQLFTGGWVMTACGLVTFAVIEFVSLGKQ